MGVIRVEKVGRESRLTVIDPDKVADLLIVYRRTFLDKLVDDFVAVYVANRAPGEQVRDAEEDAA
jgi:hypothetical protein